MRPDQAHNLRTIAEEQRLNAHRQSGPARCRVVTITGGKGGVGKTTCAVNLALALQAMGLRVLLFDADISLANVDVMLNLNPGLGLPQVLRGECALYSVIAEGPLGLHILPGGNGLAEFANLGSLQLVYLLGELRGLEQSYDVLIVDTAAGIGASVTSFCQFANDVVLVSMPEPTAMLDAYGLLKALAASQPSARMSLLMNMVRSTQEGEAAWQPLSQTVKKYLGLELELLGSIQTTRSWLAASASSGPSTSKTRSAWPAATCAI
jgi:flagellar biosynthesis protein FlhG